MANGTLYVSPGVSERMNALKIALERVVKNRCDDYLVSDLMTLFLCYLNVIKMIHSLDADLYKFPCNITTSFAREAFSILLH